jgi:hypothetical protein
MIWIMGDEAEAALVSIEAGLQVHEWERLHWHQQLAGEEGVNVVVLDGALKWDRDKFHAIIDELVARSATQWGELDLFNGKVPK